MSIDDREIYAQSYVLFCDEAPELLQKVETGLLDLNEESDRETLHELMRATHTLKGAAANVGLDPIKEISHQLESVFRALMSPEATADSEIQRLLFESYECLRLALTNELQSGTAPESTVLPRAEDLYYKLKARLSHCWDYDPIQLTSAELGVDLAKSIFETGVKQRLERMAQVLETERDPFYAASALQEQLSVLVGLAESLELSGFKEIAATAETAIAKAPQQSVDIGQAALENLWDGHARVLAGDRQRGGEPSLALRALAREVASESQKSPVEAGDGDALAAAFGSPPRSPADTDAGAASLEAAFGSFTLPEPETAEETVETIETADLDAAFGAVAAPDADAEAASLEAAFGGFTLPESTETAPAAAEATGDLDAAFGAFAAAPASEDDDDDTASLEEAFADLATPAIADDDPVGDDDLEAAFGSFETAPPVAAEPASLDEAFAGFAAAEPSATPVPVARDDAALEVEAIADFPAPETAVGDLETGVDPFSEPAPVVPATERSALAPSAPTTPTGPVPGADLATAATAVPVPHTPELETRQVRQQTDRDRASQPAAAERSREKTPIRVELGQLEHLNYLVNELTIEQNQLSLRDERFRETIVKLNTWLKQHRRTLTHLKTELPSESRNRLPDGYYEALEELSQLEQAAEDVQMLARTTATNVERERRLSQQLQDNLEAARMVPVDKVFSRFPPLVERLARTYDKDVRLELQGTQVPVDKTIADGLYDALLHLARNAFDHGIEPVELRQQRGKPAAGKIILRAYIQGNRTAIEVEDDGGGLNTEKICQRALASGQISALQAEAIRNDANPADRLLQLMCQPGFSTAEQATDLSGRGVGLDVVYTQIRNLGGTLHATSRPGRGTIFTLQIRGALLNARLLACQAGDRVYAFVSDEIAQVTMPAAGQIKWLGGQKVLRWQERTDKEPTSVPLYSLADLLPYNRALPESRALPGSSLHAETDRLNNLLSADDAMAPILLLRDARTGGYVGLEVGAIVEEQELVIKPLTEAIAAPPYVYGCTTLADGRLSLVLDGLALLDFANKQGGAVRSSSARTAPTALPAPAPSLTPGTAPGTTDNAPTAANPLAADATNPYGEFGSGIAPETGMATAVPLPEAPAVVEAGATTLLIADDSTTERRTLTAILQKAGYRVLQAKDGREALELLQDGQQVDLVLSDLEMPNLNGLEFLGLKSQNPALAALPSIILTSRARDRYQRVALGLGASAYLTKPYLDRELLDAIEAALNANSSPAR